MIVRPFLLTLGLGVVVSAVGALVAGPTGLAVTTLGFPTLILMWVGGAVGGFLMTLLMHRPVRFRRVGEPPVTSRRWPGVAFALALLAMVLGLPVVSGIRYDAALLALVGGVLIGAAPGEAIAKNRVNREQKRPRSPAEHVIEIMDVAADPRGAFERFYSPVCECGWTGLPSASLEAARGVAREHSPYLSPDVSKPLG